MNGRISSDMRISTLTRDRIGQKLAISNHVELCWVHGRRLEQSTRSICVVLAHIMATHQGPIG